MLLIHRRLGPKSDSEKTARIIHRAQRTLTRFAWFPIFTGFGIRGDHGSHTPLQDEDDEPPVELAKDCRLDIDTETRRDHGKTRAQKQTVVSGDREHRDGRAS